MNQAFATFVVIHSRRARVDMDYRFTDGRRNHAGFSTVDVDIPSKLYDACYARAEALSNTQKCRLETFTEAPHYRVFFTNFQYFLDQTFGTIELAIEGAKSKGFEATIHETMLTDENRMVGSYSPIGGFRPV